MQERKEKVLYFHLLKRRLLVNEVDSGDVLGNEVRMEGKAVEENGLHAI